MTAALTATVTGTLLSIALLIIAFVPLERLWRARAQPILRPAWGTDLCFLLGQYLLFNGLVLAVLAWFHHQLALHPPTGLRASIAALPWWTQFLLIVMLSDLCVYWGHRAQHRFSLLWRFHAIHHSVEHLDWLAAHREHPVDTIYTMTLINAPALLIGFDLAPVAGFLAFRGLWAILIHSNVSLPLGPFGVVLGDPHLHHWHHARDRFAGNYGNVSPLMDVLFGTHFRPAELPPALGLETPTPRAWPGLLWWPFRRARPAAAR